MTSGSERMPQEKNISKLKGKLLQEFLRKASGWKCIRQHHIAREFTFNDFKTALDFVNKIGKIAERIDHHPSIQLDYGKVKATIWTHKINGLSEKDFALAKKISEEFKKKR